MYTDYSYYKNDFGSQKAEEADFNRLLSLAEKYIDKITFNRIKEADDDVKNAVCAVVDILADNYQASDIVSESNDGYSVSYKRENFEKKIYKTAKTYLPSYLLYKGVEL